MREERHLLLRASARGITPVIVLAALYLALATGNGLAGGALGALAFVLHAVVYGAAATLRAFPPMAQRIAMAAGVVLIVVGAFLAPPWRPTLELGLCICAAAAFAMAFCAVAARAHELRGGDW